MYTRDFYFYGSYETKDSALFVFAVQARLYCSQIVLFMQKCSDANFRSAAAWCEL